MRRKTYGLTKERAARISRRTQQMYIEKYDDAKYGKFAKHISMSTRITDDDQFLFVQNYSETPVSDEEKKEQ